MSKIAICLWFDGRAQEATEFYVSTFRACGQDAAIVDGLSHGEAGPGPKGSALSVTFTLAGLRIIALNGGPHYTFSPATSLFVTCANQAEVDRFWRALSAGGQPQRCGWLTDRFGVSWQIVPTALGEMLQDPDRAKADRATKAMLAMVKLDIAALRRAYNDEIAA